MVKKDSKEIIKIIKSGGIGVMPTDTILGLVGSALDEKTVERIYQVRKRSPNKAPIILIGQLSDLKLFEIELDSETKKILAKVWPGPISIIFPSPLKKFTYLHRGQKTLAFRLPANKKLQNLLKKTGPLIAPSANHEGEAPAQSLKQAETYFSDQIDFYLGPAPRQKKPSTLVALTEKKFKILRDGAGQIPSKFLV